MSWNFLSIDLHFTLGRYSVGSVWYLKVNAGENTRIPNQARLKLNQNEAGTIALIQNSFQTFLTYMKKRRK